VAWDVVLAAAEDADRLADVHEPAAFAAADGGRLRRVAEGAPDAVLMWRPGEGWSTALPASDPRTALIDLYLPVCSATNARPITVGHLGQSLDGFIATHSGDSQWVTGPENVLHMHRLRALCDAVVVGSRTIAADDPQLTTRLVPGPSPVRVVLDPGRRLGSGHRVFTDDSAATIYVCAGDLVGPGETTFGRAEILGVAGNEDGLDVRELMDTLRARGCSRVFVEGGGVTISMFLLGDLLDRLHLAVAPLLIGDGRAAIRLPPAAALGDCHRPSYRVFRMGGDVLFDCDLRTRHLDGGVQTPTVTRVI